MFLYRDGESVLTCPPLFPINCHNSFTLESWGHIIIFSNVTHQGK